METTGLLVLILTNDTDEMKKFRPSFMTASRCDFDLIKLWGRGLLCSILIQPRYYWLHQSCRQRTTNSIYLDVNWTCLFKRAAYCLHHFSSLMSLCLLIPPPLPLQAGFFDICLSISFALYLLPVYFMPALPELVFSAPQASELGMLSVYYTYIFTSLVSKQTPRPFRGNIDFTPTRAHQRANVLLLSCNKTVHLISGRHLNE